MPLSVGDKLGPYEILALIGAGGMGVVYRAWDTKLGRPVAIKVLSQELADATARRRFQREAQMASSLNHPHILTVYDVGELDGTQYLVTEYIDGGTLKDWSKAESRSWRDAVELLVGVADGLAAAHEAGILHRDIKPANILITKSGYAKLADFGLAKLSERPASAADATRTITDELTRQGALIGTIAYMSPEQASGKVQDALSDVFSFAIVLYQALAGNRPFEGASDLEILQKIINAATQPLPEGIPEPVRRIVEKALQKDPADRYQSMREMVADLRRLLRQTTETQAPLAPVSTPSSPVRRFTWIASAAVVILLAGAALIVFRNLRPINPVRTQYTQLTNVDSAIDPALSPDGRMLAFVGGLGTGVQSYGAPNEIYVKLLPDGDAVQLTHDGVPFKGDPRFSPDGSRIAYSTFETSGFNTWIVPVVGGQEPRRFLTNGMGLSWIAGHANGPPTQPRLLFSYMTGKGVTMAVATSTESRSDQRTVYMEDGIMNHLPRLSPDGKQLLMNAMEAVGRWQPCRVAPFDGSSKGKKVGPQPAQCANSAWSPDGKWMYFTADTGSGNHIWRQRFPDGTPEEVTSGPTEEEGIAFAADGRSFLTSIGTYQDKIWVHDSRGDRQITSDAYSFLPTFSSGGKKLYYIVRAAGGLLLAYGSLWVTDLESGQRQRVLPEFQMWHYNVSPDGKRVVFSAPKETGRPGVWLATLDGRSAPRQLTANEGVQAFFGAGGDIFYAAYGKDDAFVYRVNADGGDSRKVLPQAVLSLNGISPDGKYVAVSVPAGMDETGSGATVLYPLDGGSPTTICICGNRARDAPEPVSWSPDGKLFYVSMVGGQSVYAVPLGAGQLLPPLPPAGIRSPAEAAALPGAKVFPVAGAFPSPNPSIYAFPKFTAQRNIFRVPVP
ncbi:MAG TPA: protein kinase [Bryobacteraceae bacterium]|jgi:serine/threonine protein kinase/sugar lactone lactonase YvrE|nr:protein kinase [Bryobacteraceae bacterium]